MPVGGASGVARPLNASIVALGLLLYQTACGETLSYGTGSTGFIKAKTKAMNNLHLVSRVLGTPFAEIVRTCLEHRGAENFFSARSSSDSDVKTIEQVVSGLYSLEKQFENNTGPAFAFQRWLGEDKDVPEAQSHTDEATTDKISENIILENVKECNLIPDPREAQAPAVATNLPGAAISSNTTSVPDSASEDIMTEDTISTRNQFSSIGETEPLDKDLIIHHEAPVEGTELPSLAGTMVDTVEQSSSLSAAKLKEMEWPAIPADDLQKHKRQDTQLHAE